MNQCIRLFTGLMAMLICSNLAAQFINGTQFTPQEREKTKTLRTQAWNERKATHVAVVSLELQTYKKGKPKGDFRKSTTETYNKEGQLQEWAFYGLKNKLNTVNAYEYDANGNMTGETCKNRRQRLVNRQAYTYANDLMTEAMTFVGKKDKATTRRTYEYDAGGWVQGYKTTRVKNGKLTGRTVCTYHEDGSKKRVEKYNGKGKLLSATDYACDQAGKTLSASNAKEINVCERFELGADGKTLRVVETIFEDKERYRSVIKYNERNQLVESTTYNQAGEILSKFGFTFDERGHTLTMTSYGKNGVLTYKSIYERDAEGRALSETRENGEGEIVSKQRYSYQTY